MANVDEAQADADLVREAGALLFGMGAPLADMMSPAIGINRRTIQRWLNGQNAVPGHLWPRLIEEVHAKQRDLARLERDLAARAAAE